MRSRRASWRRHSNRAPVRGENVQEAGSAKADARAALELELSGEVVRLAMFSVVLCCNAMPSRPTLCISSFHLPCKVGESLGPLLDFLDDMLQLLSDNLYEHVFRQALSLLWEQSLKVRHWIPEYGLRLCVDCHYCLVTPTRALSVVSTRTSLMTAPQVVQAQLSPKDGSLLSATQSSTLMHIMSCTFVGSRVSSISHSLFAKVKDASSMAVPFPSRFAKFFPRQRRWLGQQRAGSASLHEHDRAASPHPLQHL